jgi:hypothetical protein
MLHANDGESVLVQENAVLAVEENLHEARQ